jgi:FkbM family methyltransferase
MKLDYLEIGTSDFDTLVQELDTVGISVEPIKYYLDRLPNKENNTKVNCAISADNKEGEIDVYYIPDAVIEKLNVKNPHWLRGQNRVGDYHRAHKINNLEEHVVKETVKLMSIQSLIEEYNIESIGYLKIDTEGSDCGILNCLFEYIKDKPNLHPVKILFESNILSKQNDVKNVINQYKSIGYELMYSKSDTLLQKNKITPKSI